MDKLSQQGQNPTHSRERHDLVLVNVKSPSPPHKNQLFFSCVSDSLQGTLTAQDSATQGGSRTENTLGYVHRVKK